MKWSSCLLLISSLLPAVAADPLTLSLAVIKQDPKEATQPKIEPLTPQQRLQDMPLDAAENTPEARSVLTGAVNRDPRLLENVNRVRLVSTLDAALPPLKHHGGEIKPVKGAYSEKALVGSSPQIMIWGPYAELPEGRYAVVYRFQLLEDAKTPQICFLDVCHDAVTFSGLRPAKVMAPAGEWSEIGVHVKARIPMKFEYRFWPHGHAMAVDRIYVFELLEK